VWYKLFPWRQYQGCAVSSDIWAQWQLWEGKDVKPEKDAESDGDVEVSILLLKMTTKKSIIAVTPLPEMIKMTTMLDHRL
jgi:hypothetical protein